MGVPESKLVLGKHSGRHALAKRCEDLGFALTRDQLDVAYQRFTALADRKKGLRNDEISTLVHGSGHGRRPPPSDGLRSCSLAAARKPLMNLKILILPGDGIGAEVTSAAVDVLKAVAKKFGHTLELSEGLLGGIAIHKTGTPLPQDTIDKALAADATLMGAVGLPEFDNTAPEKRPEKGLLGIRAALEVFANLRPVRTWPALVESSPLKNHLVEGTDMIIVRELTGGMYYGDAARELTATARSTPWFIRARRSSASRAWRFDWRGSGARS